MPGTQLTAFYLHPGGSLRTEPAPAGAEPSRYDFDPENPCPSIGGYAHDQDIPEFMAVGGQDQRCKPQLRACRGSDRPLAERSDVLVFQTEPLSEDTEVTGPLETRFWVSSSAVDTDFVAKLIDVYPPSADYSEGYALLLSEGVVRMRYRDDRPTAKLIEPNEVYEIAVYLQPTGTLQAGPPHPPGHRELQLPGVGRQPQYRRADGPAHAYGDCAPDRVPRRRASVADRAADRFV